MSAQTSVPKTMKAYVVEGKAKASVQDKPVPTIGDDDVLVKVEYAAANPTDWKHMDMPLSPPGSILGCDYSGTVASAGKNATLKVGDRVCGSVHGGKFPDRGSYAEYLVVQSKMAIRVPEGVSAQDAATFGVGYVTAGMAIYHSQGFDMPPATPGTGKWFLVSGGSTSVGLFAIQLAHLSGFSVIATSSPRNFDLLKSLGADEVVDYSSSPTEVAEEIKRLTGGGVVAGLECVASDSNYELATRAFVPEGGELTTLLGAPEKIAKEAKDERKVSIAQILMYTIGGYSFEFIPGKITLPAKPEDHDWYLTFAELSTKLVAPGGGVKANIVDLHKGLESIPQGLDLLRNNKVSAKKVVFQIA